MSPVRTPLRSIGTLIALFSGATFGQTYTISTVAGGALPVNILARNASVAAPQILASDAAGNVFFVYEDTILRYDADTTLLTRFAGTDQTGFSGDGGAAVDAELNNPSGLAVDQAGNVYIADNGNCRVRKVSNGVITTVAGKGICSASGDGGPATAAGISPTALAVDSNGDLFISEERNNRVREVSHGTITTVAGNGAAGFSGDGGPATAAMLNGPQWIAADSSGDLFVADLTSFRVREVSNGVITTVAGNGQYNGNPGDGGPALDAVVIPRGLAVDSAGNLYISDWPHIRVVYEGSIYNYAGTDIPGFSGDYGQARYAQLSAVTGIAFDAAGDLFIADRDNNRIRKIFNALFVHGEIVTVVGNGTSGYSGDNGPATQAQLNLPQGIAVDSAGDLYIADTYNSRIRKVSNGIITTIAGGGTGRDGGPALDAQLNLPVALALDAAGNLYFTDNMTIREISDGIIRTVAGNGQAGTSGDGGPATNAELSPHAIAADSAGNLYISDWNNPYLRKVTGGIINSVDAIGVAGGSQLGNGSSLAVDSANNVYISSPKYDQIWKLSRGFTSSELSGVAVADSPSLTRPSGIAVDSAGNLYVADASSSLGTGVRKIMPGITSVIAGFGGFGLSPDGGPAFGARMANEFGQASVAVDSSGNVYVTDGNRIRKLTRVPCSYQLSQTAVALPATGGKISVDIQTQPGCLWNISGLPDWINLASPDHGAGPATATFAVAANTTSAVRRSKLILAGLFLSLTEAVIPANYKCSNMAAPMITSVHSASAFGGYSYFAPGSWLEINGTNLADPDDPRLSAPANPGQWTAADFLNGMAPANLDGISVSIDGNPAYIWYLSPAQLNVQAPEGVPGDAAIKVTNCRAASLPYVMAREEVAGGFLAPPDFDIGGTQYMAATFATDGAYVLSASAAATLGVRGRPAKAGDIIIAYGIGFGDVTPAIAPGKVADQTNGLADPVAVSFGSDPAMVLYQGLAANFVGLYEFYLQVPPGLASGDYRINVTQNGAAIPQVIFLTVKN